MLQGPGYLGNIELSYDLLAALRIGGKAFGAELAIPGTRLPVVPVTWVYSSTAVAMWSAGRRSVRSSLVLSAPARMRHLRLHGPVQRSAGSPSWRKRSVCRRKARRQGHLWHLPIDAQRDFFLVCDGAVTATLVLNDRETIFWLRTGKSICFELALWELQISFHTRWHS